MSTSQCSQCSTDGWKRRMYRMATDPKFHDVHFHVGSGSNIRKIGCNRALLSVHCPVFEAMFESAMLECSENVVKIEDIDPVVFESMLQWMSTNTLNIASICSLDDLIKLADRYQIGGLLSSCCLFLKSFTMTIHVVTDSILCKFHGVDLGLQNLKEMTIRLRILAYSSIADVIRAIGKQLQWRPVVANGESIELWRVSNRKNGTTRPNRYLSPMMDDDSYRLSHRRRREILKQESNEQRDGNGSGLTLDDDMEDDLEDDDDEEDRHQNHHEDDHHDDDNDAAMDLLDGNGGGLGLGQSAVMRASGMRCHECHKQQYDRKRSKSNKKMDWNQYSGESPTKAIYARFCCNKKRERERHYNPHPQNDDVHRFGFAPHRNAGDHQMVIQNVDDDDDHNVNDRNNNNNRIVDGGHDLDQKSNGNHAMNNNAVNGNGNGNGNGNDNAAMNRDNAQSMSHEMAVDRDAVGNGKNFRNEILLFLKYYDVYHEYLTIVGSILVDKHGPVSLICDAIRSMARWGEEHEIVLWEEEDHKTNKVNPVEIGQSIADSSLVDGDIIVFQEKSNIFTSLQLKDAKTFLAQNHEASSSSSPRHGGHGARARRGMGGGGGGNSGNNGGGGNGGGGGGGQHPGNGGMRGMAPMVDAEDF